MRRSRSVPAFLGALLLAGCALTVDQRALEGPEAVKVWEARFARSYGRSPSFDERHRFEAQLDERMRAYLNAHPELQVSPRAENLRFWQRVAVGMTKEEVLLLLGPPDQTTTDPARMEAAARRFWPEVKKRAKEMWSYPDGWSFFFDGDELADLTVLRSRFRQD